MTSLPDLRIVDRAGVANLALPAHSANRTPFELSDVGMDLVRDAERIARDVAGPNASTVDADARFPHESLTALRAAGLLGAYVPTELGGRGVSLADLAAVCFVLGQRCSSTAMVFAMHQIQVACIVHHGLDVTGVRNIAASVARHQWLLGSATSEAGVGGDVRTSLCAVELDGPQYNEGAERSRIGHPSEGAERSRIGHFTLRKEASVISYGDHCDAILATARRNRDAAPSDQVITIVLRDDAVLTRRNNWDTLGMRGTESNGYLLEATGSADNILLTPYADISAQTMLPVSHIVWAALWLGIATDAVDVARAYLRAQARKSAGDTPPAAADVAALFADLEMVRALVANAVRLYESVRHDPASLTAAGTVLRMNALKVSVSEAIRRIVAGSLQVCGIAAYRNDTPYSLGRHLRDAHSAALMVHNERVLLNNGRLLCAYKGV